MTLIVHAPNIHQGGGLTLLQAILDELKDSEDYKLIVDSRLSLSNASLEKCIVFKVNPTVKDRLAAEWRLYHIAKAGDVVLCLGNLPPLIRLDAYVYLYIQNMYLVSRTPLTHFKLSHKLRILMERMWLKIYINHSDQVIAQTPTMQHMISDHLSVEATVRPFTGKAEATLSQPVTDESPVKKYDFLYVASGEPHKNHRKLVEAWRNLAAKGVFPSLCLTVRHEDFPVLCEWIESQKENFKLHITNLGHIERKGIPELYSQAKALIYPSIMESFGLPLLEAFRAGLPIVASELDYVRDLINPEESFNPESAISIARSVERFLNLKPDLLSVLGADEFINSIKADKYD